jgi:nucleotide-binding universal stress UspA family protein
MAWQPPGGDGPACRSATPDGLLEEWRSIAQRKLLTALVDAFAADGPGVPLRIRTAQGPAGRSLVEIADRDDGLLVVGAGRRGRLRRFFSPSVSRYCLAHAACPVLAVPPSPLAADVTALSGLRAWRLRAEMRQLAKDAIRPTA